MKKFLKISVLVTLAALCLAACTSAGKIIPRKKMIRIYSDMFISDQWLSIHADANMAADTTLFYEPIFNKYGYTTEDYRASVEYYLKDPVQFSRMIKEVSLSYEKKAKILKEQQGLPEQPEIETKEADE